jgi:hypothetical protein
MGEPLTRSTPLPERTEATATEFFLRPKHCTSWFLTYDIMVKILLFLIIFQRRGKNEEKYK